MPNQKGGGSIGQSLRYLDPAAPEQTAPAGSDLLIQRGLIARPAIGGGCSARSSRGGFYPSVMTGVASNGMLFAPLAVFAGRKLLSDRARTRKGGGKKGNAWKMQREEAKAILGEIGKPSAKNILGYAAARRRGTQNADAFLDQYRQMKMRKADEFGAKRFAKEAEKELKMKAKEAKAAEKMAAKLVREETRKAKKVLREETRRVKKAVKKVKTPVSNGERAPTQLELRRQAEANAAAAAAAMKANKKRASQAAWFSLINQAQKQLEQEGTGSRKNAMKLASLIKKGENTSGFLSSLKARTQKVKTPNKPQASIPVTLSAETKKKKSPSAASKAYFTALKTAREQLSEIGAPTGPNMAKFASMTMKGENTSAWLENFKTRRPKTVKAKTVRKTRAKIQEPKKALTPLKESNENNMQGYEEDFDSEPAAE